MELAPLGPARPLESAQAREAREVQGLPPQEQVSPQVQVSPQGQLEQMLERPQPAEPSTLRQGFFFECLVGTNLHQRQLHKEPLML